MMSIKIKPSKKNKNIQTSPFKIKCMRTILLPIIVVSLSFCNANGTKNNAATPTKTAANNGDFVTAQFDGKPFTSVNKETGLFNPMTRKSTVLGEDATGRSISLSFNPALQPNENCTDCFVNLFIKKDGHTKSYIGPNIKNLVIKLTTKKGSYVEGEFSFTAKKALDDVIVVTNGKFSSTIEGLE
jgi:hypothetical protein